MILKFKTIFKEDIEGSDRKIFADLLKKQNKVKGDLLTKANRCKLICIVSKDNHPIAIGGIKEKTKTDFNLNKANLSEIEKEVRWELGYLYTEPDYSGSGIAGFLVRTLIREFGTGNLMASTEISQNPAMVRILEKNGFKQYGKPWKSEIHSNYLGLFLKFE